MSMFDKVKKALRVKTVTFDDEIADLIEACTADLRRVGIGVPVDADAGNVNEEPSEATNEGGDPLITRAVILYAKANFGFNEDSEKYQKAYDYLICGLSLAGDPDALG